MNVNRHSECVIRTFCRNHVDKSAVIRKNIISMQKSIDENNGNVFRHENGNWPFLVALVCVCVCVCAPWQLNILWHLKWDISSNYRLSQFCSQSNGAPQIIESYNNNNNGRRYALFFLHCQLFCNQCSFAACAFNVNKNETCVKNAAKQKPFTNGFLRMDFCSFHFLFGFLFHFRGSFYIFSPVFIRSNSSRKQNTTSNVITAFGMKREWAMFMAVSVWGFLCDYFYHLHNVYYKSLVYLKCFSFPSIH